MVNDKPEATTHDGSELTHEEYIDELEEMGIETEGLQDFEGRLTVQSVNALADQFIEFATIIEGGTTNQLVELHQKLEPRHARSPKRYAQHKKAVERRKKRKRGGKQ